MKNTLFTKKIVKPWNRLWKSACRNVRRLDESVSDLLADFVWLAPFFGFSMGLQWLGFPRNRHNINNFVMITLLFFIQGLQKWIFKQHQTSSSLTQYWCFLKPSQTIYSDSDWSWGVCRTCLWIIICHLEDYKQSRSLNTTYLLHLCLMLE